MLVMKHSWKAVTRQINPVLSCHSWTRCRPPSPHTQPTFPQFCCLFQPAIRHHTSAHGLYQGLPCRLSSSKLIASSCPHVVSYRCLRTRVRHKGLPQTGFGVEESAQLEITEPLNEANIEALPAGGRAEEALYAKIMTLEWPQVLATIHHYHHVLNKTHYALAMKRLHIIASEMDYEDFVVYRDRVRSQPDFKLLCALLALKGQYLEAEVAADMLLFLHEFGLDSQEPTVQVYLHLVREHLSDLPVDQLVNVANVVESMTPTPCCRLILQGILTLMLHKRDKITFLDVHEQVQLLRIYGPLFPSKTLTQLLQKIENDVDLIPDSHAHQLLRGYGQVNLKSRLIEDFCFHRISQHVPYMVAQEICDVLDTCHQGDLYELEFVNVVTKRAQELDWDGQLAVMNTLSQLTVYKDSLLQQFLADLLENNLHLVTSQNACDILRLLADSSHQLDSKDLQPLVRQLQEKVLDDCHVISAASLVDVLSSSHILGCPSESIFQHLHRHSSDDVEEALKHGEALREIPASWSSTCLAHPAYHLQSILNTNLYSPPHWLMQLVSRIVGMIECKERSVIHAALSVVAENSQILDGGSSPKGSVYDDLVLVADDSSTSRQRVAFLVLDSSNFHRNTAQLRGHAAYHARELQQEGYLVSVVNQSSYRKLCDRDRTGYIQRKLKKVKDDQNLVMMDLDWI